MNHNNLFQVWHEQFEQEHVRLIGTLGELVNGGIIEAIQHIGATSVPGMVGSSCVDIGLAVWPFPLAADKRSILEALEYRIIGGYEEAHQQRFLHESGAFQLYIVEPGTEFWFDSVLMRDYLRHNKQAREEISAKKKAAALDKSQLFIQLLPAAYQWWIDHYGFTPLEAITNELNDAAFPWYVASGWALDLFLGRVTRVHHDVDVIVPRANQFDLQKHLIERGWKFLTPYDKRLEVWPLHMRLELPRHQVHAHRADNFIDFLLTDMDGVWMYRREPFIIRSIQRMSLHSESGIPYLAPELVLLFKSKNTSNKERTKDQVDFETTFAHLERERRAWLHWALIATDPDHAWIKMIAETL
jgi:GrpB-like predicted nucleotidyltransferase (UPF0157 family)